MPRCKFCQTKFEAKYFNQKNCLQTDECIKDFNEFVKASQQKQNQRKWSQEKKELKSKLMTKKDYLNLLQPIFNTYIRFRDKGKPCISCDKVLIGKDVNASHFYSVGSSPNLRFNEDNVHSSCIKCNKELHGNALEYDLRLPNRIGAERYNKLKEDRNKPALLSIEDIKEMIFIYREKIKELKKCNPL